MVVDEYQRYLLGAAPVPPSVNEFAAYLAQLYLPRQVPPKE
jgi:hypothetical protein